jgi:hypothetical protein
MIKKILFSLLTILFFCNTLFASARNQTEAMEIAKQFYSKQPVRGIKKVSENNLSISYIKKYASIEGDSIAAFYVFNKANSGFIIVSGNDKAKQILGYSDDSSFDIDKCSENLKWWLQFYTNQISSIEQESINIYTLPLKNNTNNDFATSISPLLGNIKWNQGSPYNNLCPVINTTTGEKAVTGCVATAMAQVMKYYNWPVQGTGSNSYTTSTLGISLSLDFSQTTFDWANMTDTYTSSSTATQQNAVATLMYNCGVAVNMNYNTSSGASTTKMGLALINNFGYDSNIQQYPRNYYTRNEFGQLIKTELNEARPVLFSGVSPEGEGHEFVVDGYDTNGLFHINWGWGGMSNGYFEISALNPDAQGIGGSVGGFDSDQGITVGIQKPNSSTVATYLLCADNAPTTSTTTTTKGQTFVVNVKNLFNRGLNSFSGSIGLGIYKNNVLEQTMGTSTISSLSPNYGWNSKNFNASISSSLADGSYKIYVVYKTSSLESDWQIVRGLVGNPNYMNLTVSGNTVTLSTPTTTGPVLSLDSLAVTGNLYNMKTGRFTVKITNTGEEYNSVIGIALTSTSDNTKNQLISCPVNIASGETRTIELSDTIKMNLGEYSISAMYDPNNDYDNVSSVSAFGTAMIKNVIEAPTDAPNLTLTKVISFPDNNVVDKNNAVLSATIKNTTGIFDSKIIAFVFNTSGGSSLAYLGYQSAYFDVGEECTVKFAGSLALDNGTYKIVVYYLNSNNSWTEIGANTNYSRLQFNLTDNVTGIETPEQNEITVFPNPAKNILSINTKSELKSVTLTDISGRIIFKKTASGMNDVIAIDHINNGIYILITETSDGTFTTKIAKQ